MNGKSVHFLCLMLLPGVFSGFAQNTSGPLQGFQQRAEKFKAVIRLPRFETSTNELQETLAQTIAAGNAALDAVGATDPHKVTLRNTAGALDDIGYQIGLTANRFSVIKETSQNAALREAATEAVKKLEEWAVGLDYREDVYRVLK